MLLLLFCVTAAALSITGTIKGRTGMMRTGQAMGVIGLILCIWTLCGGD